MRDGLLVILAGAAVALVSFVVTRDDHKAPALFSGLHFPSCRDAGIVPTSRAEGTCATSHALVSVGN